MTKKMNLTYEYNEYVIGYLVTDLNTNRECNFQTKQCNTNHPEPNWKFNYGCEGDFTHEVFEEDELEIMTDFLRSHDDVRALEEAFSIIENDYDKREMFYEISSKSEYGVGERQILELAAIELLNEEDTKKYIMAAMEEDIKPSSTNDDCRKFANEMVEFAKSESKNDPNIKPFMLNKNIISIVIDYREELIDDQEED